MSVATETKVRDKTSLKPPRRWNVILLDDDKTPMEYVVMVLMEQYGHSYPTAEEIMMKVHHSGKGVAGTFSHEIAEMKSRDTMKQARQDGFSLQTMIDVE